MLQDAAAAAAVRMPYIARPRANAVTHQSRRPPLARQRLCRGSCTKANLLIVPAEELDIFRVESSLFD
jgi:hypothetical protein